MSDTPEILPCPFCGGTALLSDPDDGDPWVTCWMCPYDSPWSDSPAEAIAAHNRIASAVIERDGLRVEIAGLRTVAQECARREESLRAEVERSQNSLRAVLDCYERQVCRHEETTRGGTLWTICSSCGSRWADDEGGFQAYEEPPAITAAYAALDNAGPYRSRGPRSEAERVAAQAEEAMPV